LSARGYIKVAMIMAVVCVAVIFWLVYRLLQLPAAGQSVVALQAAQSAATASVTPVIATATASPAPSTGITATANAYPNVHQSPGLSSPKVGVLQRGDTAEVIGRTPDSVWLEVRYPGASNGVGWVSADLMTLASGANVPVVSSP
jgi:uncharacterized protein YraI